MSLNLPADCLNEIFEYLKDEDLRSCILVNRLWCETSVRILWRKIQNFNTLLKFLPNKSKLILSENGSLITSSTSRPPLFNYTSFIKSLNIFDICSSIKRFHKCRGRINLESFEKVRIMAMKQELFEMLMNQTSLKNLNFDTRNDINIPFFNYPGAEDCLRNLSELKCNSNTSYKLLQICHNLRSLRVVFRSSFSNKLIELVFGQKNLKYLKLYFQYYAKEQSLTFTKFPNTLTKLHIHRVYFRIPWSSFSGLSNLQELSLSCYDIIDKDFNKLQDVNIPQLQISKFAFDCFNNDNLSKFLEINGKNLTNLSLGQSIDCSIHLDIGNFCPNLRSLRTIFSNGNVESLKVIFDGCQQLEIIKVLRCNSFLDERKLLEIVVEFSPIKFHELSVDFGIQVSPETTFQWGLRSILERWANRVPCIPFSLTVSFYSKLDIEFSKSNIKIIKEFRESSAIKKFEIINLG
ncbi:1580_t:CDS:1 [Funneliformis geosporum]|uniref:1580_t:CDS:1 n=1 Tax=Funneliformis geosporum TaxID=1117311 RepID=A0A9W4SMV5_9GLOM|nr:1580_t:CDS:1 [Funneliformis geosporum]